MSDADLNLLPLVDDGVITELRDIMEDEFAELLNAFLDDLPVQFERMRTAVAQNGADDLYQVAHRLKSSCGSMGAARLMEWIRRLEQAGRQKNLANAAEMLQQADAVARDTRAGLQAYLD